MTRIDLPSGGWAELRDPAEVKQKDRKKVLLALDEVDGAFAESFRSAEMIVAIAVEKWSFDFPIPSVDLTSLDELSIPDSDALGAACMPFKDAIFPDFGIKIKDGQIDPKALTSS